MKKITKTLKSGITVVTYTYKTGSTECYYYFQNKELALKGTDGVLYLNVKYLVKGKPPQELKSIYQVIKRRSKAKLVSDYFNC